MTDSRANSGHRELVDDDALSNVRLHTVRGCSEAAARPRGSVARKEDGSGSPQGYLK